MTYCVAMRLDEGLVFLSDSRTNAGVDQISTFRKMTVFERPGERLLVLMSAGNLAIAQSVRQIVFEGGPDGDGRDARASEGTAGVAQRSTERTSERIAEHGRAAPADDADTIPAIWRARSLYEAVRIIGDAVRYVHQRDAAALKEAGIEFNCSFLFGGQIRGEPMRLFQVYAAGNFIEATPENPYFQIGESKYGKPIVDRIITPETTLGEAAKCALISMDSTLRSNISVGLPLDLLVYEAGALRVTKFVRVDENNEYLQMIRSTWGARLRQVFAEIPDPAWLDAPPGSGRPRLETQASAPVRAPLPPGAFEDAPSAPIQLVAQQPRR